ncbi:lipase member H [Oryzias melastigma]|uniref:Lipase, member Ia n=2 Tax=Oryzias melastigma TaxID=30732 RepID=A0A3B3DYS7_ORYME|nr:lipase member H [Oryzias melastigma]
MWQYLGIALLISVQINQAQTCDSFKPLTILHSFVGTNVRVRLLLYTRIDSDCGVLLSHTNLSAHPQFNFSRPTTFVIHGFRPTGSAPAWLNKIRELLLARSNINLVIVDWNHGAATINYWTAVENTHKVAENLTAFINLTLDHGANLSSIHLIGVSLGAHISGFVGANFHGKIGRITGLDAAGPEFTGTSPEKRLDPTDAQFVDVLHTDMDSLGFRETLGHIDFYANGGADQPNCPKTIFSGESYFKCDHQRSVNLFMDTINGTCSSWAYPCLSYRDFLDGKCLKCDTFGTLGCPLFGYDSIKWKDYLPQPSLAKYYFSTNGESPYCKTNFKVDITVWNTETKMGYITVKLYGDNEEAVATIKHKRPEFRKYKETALMAGFDRPISSLKNMSLMFHTGKVLQPKHKLRILRVRLTPLEPVEKPLCRYDVLLEENKEVSFKPVPCGDATF